MARAFFCAVSQNRVSAVFRFLPRQPNWAVASLIGPLLSVLAAFFVSLVEGYAHCWLVISNTHFPRKSSRNLEGKVGVQPPRVYTGCTRSVPKNKQGAQPIDNKELARLLNLVAAVGLEPTTYGL